MKTIKVEYIEPVFVKTIPEKDKLEQGKLYISEEYYCSIHLCLCGCGEQVCLPLSESGWNLIKHEDGKVSFTPSIGNFQFPCKSHYIITKNKANFV